VRDIEEIDTQNNADTPRTLTLPSSSTPVGTDETAHCRIELRIAWIWSPVRESQLRGGNMVAE
jgi:hypothetical protein